MRRSVYVKSEDEELFEWAEQKAPEGSLSALIAIALRKLREEKGDTTFLKPTPMPRILEIPSLLTVLQDVANSNKEIQKSVEDIRRMHYNYECNTYLKQNGCDHALGVLSGSYKIVHKSSSDSVKNDLSCWFTYCPNCGKKIL